MLLVHFSEESVFSLHYDNIYFGFRMTKARSHDFNWRGCRYKMLYEVSFFISYFEHYLTGHLIVVTHINAGDVILCKFNYDLRHLT